MNIGNHIKVKYEVRQGGKYCRAFKTLKEAEDLVAEGGFPILVCPGIPNMPDVSIVKITTETLLVKKVTDYYEQSKDDLETPREEKTSRVTYK